MRLPTVVFAASLLALSGCSGSPDAGSTLTEQVEDLGLVATGDTGVIRGLVVDAAIRPVAGAAVTAACGTAKLHTNTTGTGSFGLSRVPAGTCFVAVAKAGYHPTQASVDVVAGVAEPEPLKVRLEADAATSPYVDVVVFKGFMECGVQTPAVGVAVCFAVNSFSGENITNDDTQARYLFNPGITWLQSEMVWTATNPLGEEMSLLHSYSCEGQSLYCDFEATGTSPLLLVQNQTNVDVLGLNDGDELYMRVFAEALNATRPPPPVEGTCVPDPVLGGERCLTGVGATVEQSFEIYTHAFHGFEPTPGWRFTRDGAPAVPA